MDIPEIMRKKTRRLLSLKIGRMIIEFLVSDEKSLGTEKIYLESSGVAKNLYHELGFTDMADYMKLSENVQSQLNLRT